MGSNWKIWLRLTSGELTAKKGFSVVAPTRRIRPGFDVAEEDVLLGAVEAVDFVEEEDGALAGVAEAILGGVEDGADFLHADGGGVDLLEVAFGVLGDERGEGGFAGAWRAVEDDAGQPVGFEHAAEEFAGAEEMLLADEFLEGAGRMRTASGATRCIFFFRLSAKRSLMSVQLSGSAISTGPVSTARRS